MSKYLNTIKNIFPPHILRLQRQKQSHEVNPIRLLTVSGISCSLSSKQYNHHLPLSFHYFLSHVFSRQPWLWGPKPEFRQRSRRKKTSGHSLCADWRYVPECNCSGPLEMPQLSSVVSSNVALFS